MAKPIWALIWANAAIVPADLEEPIVAKQNNGWEAGEKPPHKNFNWFWNKICNSFKILNEQGVFEWDAATSYLKDAIVLHSGSAYISNVAGNINNIPSSSSTSWQLLRLSNVTIADLQPSNGQVGNLWINSTNGVLSYCSVAAPTNTWIALTSGNLGMVQKANATGSANALIAAFSPAFTSLADIKFIMLNAAFANTSSIVTLSIDALATRDLVKDNNKPLRSGDIPGNDAELIITYSPVLDKYVLLNPSGAPDQFMPYAAKASASFRYTGGVLSTNKAYNISNITRIAKGRYQLTFTNPLPDANYTVVFGNTAGQGGTNGSIFSSGGWDAAPDDKNVNTLTISFGNGIDYRDCYEMDVVII